MVFKRGDALRTITHSLGCIVSTCELQGVLKLFDDHVLAQYFFCRVLNSIFSLQLKEMDRIQTNYPAIDLGDQANRIAFQITADRKSDKIQHTLDRFVGHGLHDQYDILRILVLGNRQGTYKSVTVPQALQFDCDRDILGVQELLKHIDTLPTPRLVALAGIFVEELSQFASHNACSQQAPDQEKKVLEYLAEYHKVVEKHRGYILTQIILLQGLTDLSAWKRATVDGTLKQFQKLCDSRSELVASPESAALIGSVATLGPILSAEVTEPTEEDRQQRISWDRWSRLTFELGESGPASDAQVKAWQQATLSFLNASLTAIHAKERVIAQAARKWLAEQTATAAAMRLYYSALAKARSGEVKGAKTDYETLLALPEVPGVWRAAARFDLALMKEKAGDRQGSIAEYDFLLELSGIHPNQRAKALLNRGVARSRSGDTSGALTDFDAIVGQNDAPNDQRGMAYLNRAAIKYEAGDRQAALADLNAGLELPDVPFEAKAGALLSRAVCETILGDFQGSIRDYDVLLSLPGISQSQRAQALLNRGVEKGSHDDSGGALADYDAILNSSDSPSEYRALAFLNRGVLKAVAGEYEGASTDLDSALGLAELPVEHRAPALRQRALVRDSLGDLTGASADYDALIATVDLPHEMKLEAYACRAAIRCDLGDLAGAEADFDSVLSLPDLTAAVRAVALLNRGQVKQDRGNRLGALADFNALLAIPDVAEEIRSAAIIMSNSARNGDDGKEKGTR